MRLIHFSPEGNLIPQNLKGDGTNTVPGMARFSAYGQIMKNSPDRAGHRSVYFPHKEYVFQYYDSVGAFCSLKRGVRIRALVPSELLLFGLLRTDVTIELDHDQAPYYGVQGHFVIKGVTSAIFDVSTGQPSEPLLVVAPVSSKTFFKV